MDTSSKGGTAPRNYFGGKHEGFTVVELLVVMTTMAILAVMLLPALAGTQAQSKTTACAARYRQWAASANLYANDSRGWLPSFTPAGGAGYAWDVGTNMISALYPYGMDVPNWFCPMRPTQLDAANQWWQIHSGQPIQNDTDLRLYFSRNYPQECIINDNYWVPRGTSPGSTTTFPTDYSTRPQPIWPVWLKNQPTLPTSVIYGWPQRLHDMAVPCVPIVSDSAGSGQGGGLISPGPGSPSVTNISPNTAHFLDGILIGVNCAYADGHVAGHTPDQMRCVYQPAGGGPYWFY